MVEITPNFHTIVTNFNYENPPTTRIYHLYTSLLGNRSRRKFHERYIYRNDQTEIFKNEKNLMARSEKISSRSKALENILSLLASAGPNYRVLLRVHKTLRTQRDSFVLYNTFILHTSRQPVGRSVSRQLKPSHYPVILRPGHTFATW